MTRSRATEPSRRDARSSESDQAETTSSEPRNTRPAAELHPGAWWIWALCLAAAANRTTNPLLLALTVAVAGYVAVTCRPAGRPDARGGFGSFLRLGLMVLLIRTIFHILLGSVGGQDVLFTLPTVPLPGWATGVQLGGPVYADGLIGTVYDASRLAVMLCCIGAAVALANPRRLLASLPGALYEVGVAVVVAMSLAPELITSAQRVRRARELRGDVLANGRGPIVKVRAWVRTAGPVLADATDQSLTLAASMDARGYGRNRTLPRSQRMLTGGLVLVGLLGICLGAYGMLDATSSTAVTLTALAVGIGATVGGLSLGSRRVSRTRFQATRWTWREGVVIGSGLVALGGSVLAEVLGIPLDPPNLLALPAVPILPFLAVLVAAAPSMIGGRP